MVKHRDAELHYPSQSEFTTATIYFTTATVYYHIARSSPHIMSLATTYVGLHIRPDRKREVDWFIRLIEQADYNRIMV